MTIDDDHGRKIMRILGDRLKMLREERGLELQDAATPNGISRTFLWDIEMGARRAHTGVLTRLADFYGVSVDFLLGRTDERLPSAAGALDLAPEFREAWKEIQSRHEMLTLFRTSRDLSARQIQKLCEMIKAIREGENTKGE